ncbi:MAG: outer membrane lipoprotein-sorting protein [Bermanella sp.]|nr:outer membrane lipoprotein-sorting protein [Bermanella sp.]
MLMKKTLIGTAVALSLAAGNVLAAVSASEAARLGKDLTPIGAERKGNGGAIPAWTGGIESPAGFKMGDKHIDPFPGDKVQFTITAQNYTKYAANLTEGQIAMFKKYPDTYKMPVYQTRRSSGYPQNVYDKTKENATKTKLVDGGNGMSNYDVGVPFPIPADGMEVIWNHIVRYRGGSVSRVVGQATPQANGSYTMVKFNDEFTFKNKLSDYNPATMQDNNILFYFKQEVVSPARLAGNVLLVHETLDQVKEPRKAWIYNAGQRRVRRAPQVAYDGPGTASDGLRTSDNFDMYNGAPDRYNWKLIGKKEIYVPYNSYKLNSGDVKYDDIIKAGHINQDLTRYELHRVWHVESTLKEGQRHIYGKRTFYIDEDTWQATEIDHFDGRGDLWRVAEAHNMFFYDHKVPWYTIETLYDLQSGRYLALGLDNEESKPYNFGFTRSEKDYTPSALRRSGVR